jgi:hypothetical protein
LCDYKIHSERNHDGPRTNTSEELFQFAGLEIRFLLTSSDSNGTMSVFEFSVPAKQLTVICPGVMGPEYFREVRQLLSSGAPPNPAAMAETMRCHGMTPVVHKSTAQSIRARY